MHPRAIIFDMDGTIVETHTIWRQATSALLQTCNVVLESEEHDLFHSQIHSLSTQEVCRIIKQMSDTTLSIEEMVKMKHKLAHDLYEQGQGIVLVSGFVEFHAAVIRANLKTGVATNADENTVHITNRLVNLSHYFGTHLYSIKSVNYRCKPHPDIYLHVAEKLEMAPADCIAIEDSAHGIAAARAAGMRCIGINTGKDLRQLREANHIINTYHDLTIEGLQHIK